jgi:hypothetical protein
VFQGGIAPQEILDVIFTKEAARKIKGKGLASMER